MSQYDFGTIDPATKTGTQLAADLNAWRTALHSAHKGASRPTYAIAGTVWVADAGTPWVVYIFDGADDIQIGTINATTNEFIPYGKNIASGLCPLDSNIKVPTANLPTIPIANGGTGVITHTANALFVGNGTGAITYLAPGASGNVPVSNGTSWVGGSPSVADGAVTAPKLSGAQTGTAPIFGARAWVTFNGSTATIAASGNMPSVTKNATGNYTLNFTTAMLSSSGYAVFALSNQQQTFIHISSRATTSCTILVRDVNNSAIDPTVVTCIIFE